MADTDLEPPPGWRTSSDDMADLVRRTDWSATPLGSRGGWSQSLTLAVGMVLASAFPMALRWGPDFILIYNDAYRPILGDKHPWVLGRPAREAWSEVWPQIAPAHEAILNAKTPSIFADDIILRIQRHGSTWENAHFTLGYSAIEDSTAARGVGGILVNAVEITDRVLAEEARRISEERYELALGAAGAIGAWDWDVVNNRVTANGTFARLYSVDPQNASVGEPIDTFLAGLHPDDRERVTAEVNHALQTHGNFASEYRLVQQDGSIVWVFARGRVHYNAEGAPVGFRCDGRHHRSQTH